MQYVLLAICALIGYALGNFSTGSIVAWSTSKVDIHKRGSGNPGATNVLRTLGVKAALLTFAGDVTKGLLGALIGWLIAGYNGSCVGALFAIIGHDWPVFYHFRGGKGIATSFGALLFLQPWVALILLGVHLLATVTTKYVSVASIFAALCSPLLCWAFGAGLFEILLAAFIAFAAIMRHLSNIKRLIAREESKTDLFKMIRDKGGKHK